MYQLLILLSLSPVNREHSEKKFIVFPVPSRDVTNQTLPGQELLNYSQPEFSFDIPAGDWETITFFYSEGTVVQKSLSLKSPLHILNWGVGVCSMSKSRG